MALSQLFWNVLMPWNLKSTYFSLKIIHFLSLNIWYVIYVVFWIKYWNLKLPHHCILFLFTICTVSQLFWNRVCNYSFKYMKYVNVKYMGIEPMTLANSRNWKLCFIENVFHFVWKYNMSSSSAYISLKWLNYGISICHLVSHQTVII